MATEQTVAVQVTPEGTIPIPEAFRKALGLVPLQTVYLKKENGRLVVMVSRRDVGDRIVELLRAAFSGVTQADIDAGRAEDANRI